MENAATKPQRRIHPEHNNRWGGLVLIIIGVLFLLSKLPATSGMFPHWFFTWPMLLVGIGIFSGIKNGFRNAAWLVLILIGGYFLMHENGLISLNLRPYAFPIGIILLGIFIIIKKNRFKDNCRPHHRFGRHAGKNWQYAQEGEATETETSDDVVSISATFGSVERNVFSKNFRGGNISSAFGGAQVNFTQADFQGTAVVDVSVMFGGVDIIIPANWNLKNEISVIFGGIEDRRTVSANIQESGKTLILKGNIMFGGVEIKSY